MSNGPGPSDREAPFASALKSAILLIALYSYFVGWVYAYHLYSRLGLSLSAVDIPAYYFFVYSYFVLPTPSLRLWSIIQFAILTLVLLGIFLWIQSGRGKAFFALFLVALFPLLFVHAEKQAGIRATELRTGRANPVTLTIRPEATPGLSKTFVAANNTGRLYLLLETKDRFYTFYQPPGEKGGAPFRLRLLDCEIRCVPR